MHHDYQIGGSVCTLQSSVMQIAEQNCYAGCRVEFLCRLQSGVIQVVEQKRYKDSRAMSCRGQRRVMQTAEECHTHCRVVSCRLHNSVQFIHFMKAARVYDLPLLQYQVGSQYQFIRFVCNWPTIAVVMMTSGGQREPGGSLVIIPPNIALG